uniref:M67 family peptidase n=1 Tax=Anaerolinea thermolimosa TaxID=229919 RepID=A0A7C4PNI5_9CHLR
MKIRLTRSHLQQMINHATQTLPEEACGLIGGVAGEARLVIPVTNSLHSAVRFRMEPHEQLRAFQRFETEGLELLAIYHSHPTGPPAPSETDRAEFSYPGVAYVILSGAPSGWQWNAFQLDHERVTPCNVEITED